MADTLSTGFSGRDLTLTWNGAAIAGCREKSITINGEPIDVTSDDDSGWRNVLESPAQKQVDLSISGVTKSHVLKTDWSGDNRTRAVVITYPDGSTISGNFFLSDYSESGAYNDAVTFDATLMSDGTVTFSFV